MTLLVALLLAAPAGAADQAPIRVSGVEQRQTIACDGRDVVVDGVDHQLTFTGACASLSLTGTDSTVTIELKPGASVRVEGAGQTVRWRADGAPPRVRITGVDNSVARQP